jgi:hypothetical protein
VAFRAVAFRVVDFPVGQDFQWADRVAQVVPCLADVVIEGVAIEEEATGAVAIAAVLVAIEEGLEGIAAVLTPHRS